ncbi:MAG: exodeoxyribonuclease VII large subunit [Oscillospiraceae bacterium]|nr:exodeoxyribonuclease VII large subunit [Oscillospiraceae bacterium]
MENARLTLTVTELNQAVKDALESNPFFADLCVRGELSNYKIYPSGHHYFTLKDQNSSLRCVMFRGSAQHLRFRPENGMKVSVFGSVRVYPRDGAYQLYATAIMPEGAGDLQVAFEQLKRKLDEEGLFDPAHKKPLPHFPGRIALITSSAGAAVHDMIRIFGRRWPMAELVLLPVRVQGTEAPAEIAGAIRYANEFRVADLIITGRGGGSLEDLWAFNDERVARAIYHSQLPVISAVGHEPDVTISDYVADRRASTPSNAAEIAVPDQRAMQDELRAMETRLAAPVEAVLKRCRQHLENLGKKRVLSDSEAFVDLRRMELDRQSERLSSAYRRILLEKKGLVAKEAAALDAMSPMKVLARGYAVATDHAGTVVRSVEQLTAGEHLLLRLQDGQTSCVVEEWNHAGTVI